MTEIAAFNFINRQLANTEAARDRIAALGRNHELWSLLMRDLARDGNRLPEPIKQELLGLAAWSMRYSTLAIVNDLPIQPLIDVNQNIVDGLVAQNAMIGSLVCGGLSAPIAV